MPLRRDRGSFETVYSNSGFGQRYEGDIKQQNFSVGSLRDTNREQLQSTHNTKLLDDKVESRWAREPSFGVPGRINLY